MAGAPGEEQEETGPLVFQRGKKLNDEYYIVSVHDNAEGAYVKVSAYELETSDTFDLSYTYADFDALFKTHPELVNPAKKEGRYDWVIDRLDFASEGGTAAKRLTLASEPTAEDETPAAKTGAPTKAAPKERMTYGERVKLRQEAEKLEEKRAQNIALKSERNRKAFVAELQEKRKLEELKVQSRKQRIDEERAERREKSEMQHHLDEERRKRYAENDKKREERIAALAAERKTRDLSQIKEIIETSQQKKEAMRKKLEEARERKIEEDKAAHAEIAVHKEEEKKVEQKRDQKIAERNARLKQAEREYLAYRQKRIDEIAQEKLEAESAKQAYLRERATQRASQLRQKHEKIEAWETKDDERTQNNMKKEHQRNMLMLDHIESLRKQFNRQQQDAASRKQASLEQRKEAEAKAAADREAENAHKAEMEQRRLANISHKEKHREDKNQDYCRHIRDLKTAEALRLREQMEQVEYAKDQTREARMREREFQSEQDQAAAAINALREENIRKREKERDEKFAQALADEKQKEHQRKLEQQARKHQRRQQEEERAEKSQEEENQRRRQMQTLEQQRETMIRDRAVERNKREQERHKPGPGDHASQAPVTAEG
uniref:Uncharacterized protein n=1 Tax=Strombidinopsis acuminata TaxID=141414 RepID=A0A7S3S8U4_9SPIT